MSVTFLASNDTKVTVISGWNGSYGPMGPGGTCQRSRLGDGVFDRCSLGPKRLLEIVFFSLKSPFLRGVQRYVLGLKCH